MRLPLSYPILLTLLGALLGTFAAAPAGAATLFDSWYGTPQAGGSARGVAMGGVGVSLLQGATAAWQNPALLAGAKSGRHLELHGSLSQRHEDRYVPLYNSFDSYVADTVFATNRQSYGDVEGGVMVGGLGGRGMGFSLGLYDRYDLGYNYFEEIRDPDFRNDPRDQVLQRNLAEANGHVRSLSAGYGIELVEGLSIGAGLHLYRGKLENFSVEAPTDADPTIRRSERDLDGQGFSIGAAASLSDRVDLGLRFDAAFTLNGNHSASLTEGDSTVADPTQPASGDYGSRYPATVAFGATFHPRAELKTAFSLELVRRFWEDSEDEWLDAGGSTFGPVSPLRDTWEARMGLEHLFYNGTPLRLGFRFLENHADLESYRSIYSAGTAQDFGGFELAVTLRFSSQTSRQDYLFDPDVPGFSPPQRRNKVEDSILDLVLGASRTF